jgi:hypothetical protein
MHDHASLTRAVRAARQPADVYRALERWQGAPLEAATLVATHTPVWDDGLLVLGLMQPEERIRITLLENPNRTPEVNARIADWTMNRIRGRAQSSEFAAYALLEQMVQGGAVPLDSPILGELRDLARAAPMREVLTTRQSGALRVLLAHPELPASEFARLYEEFCERLPPELRMVVLADPRTAAPLRHELARASVPTADGWELHEVRKHKHVRLDPVCRELLLERLHQLKYPAQAFQEFILDAAQDDCGPLLGTWLKQNVEEAKEFIRGHVSEFAHALTPEFVQALLESPDAEVRLAAILLVGQAGERLSQPAYSEATRSAAPTRSNAERQAAPVPSEDGALAVRTSRRQ